VTVRIRGDLPGLSASGTTIRPTAGKETTRVTRQKSAEAVLAAGTCKAVKGRMSDEGSDGKLVIEGQHRSQLTLWASGDAEHVNPAEHTGEPFVGANRDEPSPPKAEGLWEQAFFPANLLRALQRVERNGGAAGIDGIEVSELRTHSTPTGSSGRQQLDAAPTDCSPCKGFDP
jgi:hypothetical protein